MDLFVLNSSYFVVLILVRIQIDKTLKKSLNHPRTQMGAPLVALAPPNKCGPPRYPYALTNGQNQALSMYKRRDTVRDILSV
jgi:hypothetical protein